MTIRVGEAETENGAAEAVLVHGSRLSRTMQSLVLSYNAQTVLWLATIAGFIVFILGVGNRFTRGPLFLYIPDVDLIPPLSHAAWLRAFTVHQQSPLWALCGGYQVGGMESLSVYQSLYLWEWMREGAVFVLTVSLFLLGAAMVQRYLRRRLAGDRSPLLWTGGFALAYLALRWVSDHAGFFATLNIGQHRHAVDVTFASIGLAVLLAAAFSGREFVGAAFPSPVLHFKSQSAPSSAPSEHRLPKGRRKLAFFPLSPRGEGRFAPSLIFASGIALAIAFGAITEALDAGVLWTSFPGYDGHLLPPANRLFALHPLGRNFTENGYLVQAVHRVLTIALWLAAAVMTFRRLRQGGAWGAPAIVLGLLTLEAVLGVFTLTLGQPVVLSIVHQVVAVLVLAAAVQLAATR